MNKIKKYWDVKNKKENEKNIGELYLYGDISNYNFWGDDVTPQQLEKDLKDLGSLDELNIYINSAGGSVFAGMAIYNIIKRNKASVKSAYIDGVCASIASVIMLSADFTFMPSNTMLMIHNPSACCCGESKDMLKMSETLNTIRDTIINVYKEKTNLSEEELKNMMDNETWMDMNKAIEYGFVDEEADKDIENIISDEYLMMNSVKVPLNNNNNSFLNSIEKINKVKESGIIKDNKVLDEQRNKIMNLRKKIGGIN